MEIDPMQDELDYRRINNEVAENYVKQCISAGITCTGDGLLRDFIARGNYRGALLVIDKAIEDRNNEIDFLEILKINLTTEINNE